MPFHNRLTALAIVSMSLGWLNESYRFTEGVANPDHVMGVAVLVSVVLIGLETVRTRAEAWESGESLWQQYADPQGPVATDIVGIIASLVGLLLAASYLDIYTAPFRVYAFLGGIGVCIAVLFLSYDVVRKHATAQDHPNQNTD